MAAAQGQVHGRQGLQRSTGLGAAGHPGTSTKCARNCRAGGHGSDGTASGLLSTSLPSSECGTGACGNAAPSRSPGRQRRGSARSGSRYESLVLPVARLPGSERVAAGRRRGIAGGGRQRVIKQPQGVRNKNLQFIPAPLPPMAMAATAAAPAHRTAGTAGAPPQQLAAQPGIRQRPLRWLASQRGSSAEDSQHRARRQGLHHAGAGAAVAGSWSRCSSGWQRSHR
jgi:hypothetical protein